jgi:Flp pilus assembly protein CpaB
VKKKTPPYAFVGAFVLFIFAALLLWHWTYVKQQEEDARIAELQKESEDALQKAKDTQVVIEPTQTNMRKVLYATQPVEPGMHISPSFYETKLTPIDILPDAYTDKDDITGWVAVRHIEKGDPLNPHNIGKNMPSLSARLAPGMRAVSLPFFNSDLNDTGGFIVDGDRVDLLYTVIGSGTADNAANVQTILQNVKLLYVPGPTQRSDETEGVVPATSPGAQVAVTFEVTPEMAQELIYLTSATRRGKFSMILRSSHDSNILKIKPFTLADSDPDNMKKIQQVADKSFQRVKDLAAEIAAKEKEAQGNTNETNTPPATP